MAYQQPSYNLTAAARGNKHLDDALRSFEQRLGNLETKTGTQSVDLDKRAPIAAKPPLAQLSVSAKSSTGRFVVTVTNPEFISPIGKGNLPHSPIYHKLTYSTYSDFSQNVTSLPPGHQTYFPVIEDPGTTLHFKLQSSIDGVNWNAPVLSGPVRA